MRRPGGNSGPLSFCLSPQQFDIPAIADITGGFVYARLQNGTEKLKAGAAEEGVALKMETTTNERARLHPPSPILIVAVRRTEFFPAHHLPTI